MLNAILDSKVKVGDNWSEQNAIQSEFSDSRIAVRQKNETSRRKFDLSINWEGWRCLKLFDSKIKSLEMIIFAEPTKKAFGSDNERRKN